MKHITLQLKGQKPLYRQIYDFFVQEIRLGNLSSGEKIPSKRRLAADLNISVNTVDTAYQMLAAEGYLQAHTKSEFTVCKLEKLSFSPVSTALPEEPVIKQWRYNFETSSIDTSLFPFKSWRRIQRDLLAGNPNLLNHGDRRGDFELRNAISKHLHEYRGARCGAHQIVIGAGIEYLLGLLARLFSECVFAIESPGYARTHRILENNGAAITFLPVDTQGLQPDALEQSDAKLVYITPSHQFPTGVTMPVGRRTELLQWASAAPGRYLIEDDYDSEFRFDGRPIPCLQGLDDGEHVIYISTFSKSIAPAIRIAYMVLPEPLLPLFTDVYGFYSCTVNRFDQQTLYRFMEEGHFARHLARLRSAYRIRRDTLVDALKSTLPAKNIAIHGSHTGLHLLLDVKNGMTQQQLVSCAAAQDVRLTGLSSYDWLNTPAITQSPSVVLGYAGIADQTILPAVQALATAWKQPPAPV